MKKTEDKENSHLKVKKWTIIFTFLKGKNYYKLLIRSSKIKNFDLDETTLNTQALYF